MSVFRVSDDVSLLDVHLQGVGRCQFSGLVSVFGVSDDVSLLDVRLQDVSFFAWCRYSGYRLMSVFWPSVGIWGIG